MSLTNEYTDNFFIGESSILDAHIRLCFCAFHYERPCIPSNPAAQYFLLEVKTITKSPENGIAESVKSCNLHKKGRIENDFKGQIASRIQFRPTNIAYKLMFAIKNYQ